jgi:hypothetical protein
LVSRELMRVVQRLQPWRPASRGPVSFFSRVAFVSVAVWWPW